MAAKKTHYKVNEAKTHLSRILAELDHGELDEVIIQIKDRPVARLLPFKQKSSESAFGLFKGIKISDDFKMPEPEWNDYV